MKRILSISFFLMGICISAQNKDIDWNNYKVWENKTTYKRTIIVNQKHPNASDDNLGTTDSPYKTINKAAQVVKPGERVLIYSGIYRESIYPKHGGTAEDQMIAYEAAPGEEVIIKGSKILNQKWEQRKVYTDVLADPNTTYTWSRRTWVTTVPDNFFDKEYFPFQLSNILPKEHQLMPWAKLVKDMPPFTSTRALIFQNGRRMIQLDTYSDVVRVPGSFWVDNDGKTLHIHGFDSKNPNSSVIEIATQQHLLKPQRVGLNYIQLKGLTFEHCANGFLRTSTGAITALGGHHWIVENNTIRQINSSGLEFGFYAYEIEDKNPENIKRDLKDNIGGHLIRNNTIYECGTAGIRSFVVKDAVVSGNHIYNCGWQDAENYWECSGIKMLICYNTLVSDNHIHDIQGGNGIWLDWDIRYSRVTRNKIHDVQNIQGGIFIEASHYPNLVDNNFIWNIDGNGIYANDTDYLRVYHNLVANITGNVVHAIVQTDRYQNGRKLTAEENLVYNNIFVNGKPIRFSSNSNKVENNLFINAKLPRVFDVNTIAEGNSVVDAEIEFNADVQNFIFHTNADLNKVPVLRDVKADFYNKSKDSETTYPGPFNTLSNNLSLILYEN